MKLARSEPQLELVCVGIHVKAKGSLAVIVVALLVAVSIALRALHIS